MLRISIIVPAYNRQKFIGKCLDAIRRSEYKDYKLIVVDGGSADRTADIAEKYADEVVRLKNNPVRSYVRSSGLEFVEGEIVVNIDSDVIIKPDTLGKIANYFSKNPDTDAITGILSKQHPNPDFFSQYKNLYMHYIFSRLPEQVTFLYGTIYAVRKNCLDNYNSDIRIADDTEMGQKLLSQGKRIVLLKDLDVIHSKRYTALSFIQNDFRIPFDWAKIFLKFRAWKQFIRYKTGFAHASKRQIVSITLAYLILFLFFLKNLTLSLLIFLAWILLNVHFLLFLFKEKGFIFSILAFFLTFFDNIIMGSGIIFGFIDFCFGIIKHRT